MALVANLPVVNGLLKWRVLRVRPIEQLPPVIGLREGLTPAQVAGRIGVPASELARLGITNYSINRVQLQEALKREMPEGFEMRRWEARTVDNAVRAIIGRVGSEIPALELDVDKAVEHLKTLAGYEDRDKRNEAIYAVSHDEDCRKHLQIVINITEKYSPYVNKDQSESIDNQSAIVGRLYTYEYIAGRIERERGFSIKGTQFESKLQHERLTYSRTLRPEGVFH